MDDSIRSTLRRTNLYVRLACAYVVLLTLFSGLAELRFWLHAPAFQWTAQNIYALWRACMLPFFAILAVKTWQYSTHLRELSAGDAAISVVDKRVSESMVNTWSWFNVIWLLHVAAALTGFVAAMMGFS